MKSDSNPPRRAAARLRLRVTAAAESIIRSGHPWLFADSIKEQNRAGKTGELAVIFDRRDRFLAAGLFDADSPIRVRILHAGKPETIDTEWWLARACASLERRKRLFDSETDGWRCINGESDSWPGLVLDRYDATLVLKLYTAAWLVRLDEIVEIFKKNFPAIRIVLRLSRNIQDIARKEFKMTDGRLLFGSSLKGPVVFLESGLRFEADVLRGQKTGFFLDQRENRRLVESLSRNRAVLNAFSFSGGFSLYAARGGASSVTDLDISSHALESAQLNFRLNHATAAIKRCPHEVVKADAFEWLAAQKSPRFDLIILDPPSLARREPERTTAIRAYSRLGALGIHCLRPNGILVAASCSAHVTKEEFFDAVRLSASRSGRKFSVLRTTGHAPDHPATFKEAEYLKAIYLEIR